MEQEIRKYALLNASRYGGKANPGSVISKLIGEHPEVKKDMKRVSELVRKIIADVEKLSVEKQIEELKRIAPELLEQKKEEKPKDLPDLPNATEGNVVTRIPPEPSKYAHLGHALTFLTSFLFAQKYKGTCILRFEDTNPEKSSQEYVDSMREDIRWLGISCAAEVFVSDYLDHMYKEAERLIDTKDAYACTCPQETMQKLRNEKLPCPHRKTRVAANKKLWHDMLARTFKEGEISLRLNGDMESHNGVMRDPVLFRLDYNPHYRQATKYTVWPLYDFASVIMEELNGTTHVMRSAEFVLRAELHEHIRKRLNYRPLAVFEFGRFNVIGATTKGREIRDLIESGKMIGWDDPRLVTLKALRRRGILPEAIKQIVYEVGFKRDQANIDFGMLASINRKLIDPGAKRYFFVANPVPITVKGAPAKEVHLKLHPDQEEKGQRKLITTTKFFIPQEDAQGLETGKIYRLMECFNFKKGAKSCAFDSESIDDFRKIGEKTMHWLPAESKDLIPVVVLMPDATTQEGLGEPTLKNVKVNEVIQFERFGFCRLDTIEKGVYTFWFSHK